MKRNKKFRKNKSFSRAKLFKLSVSVFRQFPNKKLNYKQLSKILKIKESGVKILLIKVLAEMKTNGFLEEIQRGSYKLIEKKHKIISFIKNTNSRGVYLDLDENNELFISKEYSLFALAGDKVEVLLFPKRKNKYEGEVVAVLQRNKTNFVGKIDSSSANFFLVPDDKKVYFDIFLPSDSVDKKHLNKKVLVNIEGWNSNYKNPIGKVVKIIGNINNNDSEISSILYDYGFNLSFNSRVEKFASEINEKICKKEISKRLDLRSVLTFTIDPEDAKDFDDALSIKKLENNNLEVGVHIADVSYYVPQGSLIDKEAAERATSVYLVDRVIPMLPERLSNNICSLKPNVDRLAFSVIFEINKKAELINYTISKSIIHSNARITYENAQKIIDEKKGAFSKELILLSSLAKKLRKKRNSIHFQSSEVKFVLDSEKKPIDIYFKESLSTNYLVEEFMLLTNKTIAKHISVPKKSDTPFIYRVHDLPDMEKIKNLKNILKKFDYSINNENSKNLIKSLKILLLNVNGKKEQHMIETLTKRSMAKAIYSTNNIGHFGLSFNYYSHFTSPIRRYPDLIVHRLLENYIEGKKLENKESLEAVCHYCSKMEKSASKAERDSIKYMQVKYMENRIGKKYEGIISGVTEWGLYVEIINNKCEGLIKINSINDDHYFYNEKKHALIGYNKKKCYQLGQQVKIKIKNVNLENRQLYFLLI